MHNFNAYSTCKFLEKLLSQTLRELIPGSLCTLIRETTFSQGLHPHLCMGWFIGLRDNEGDVQLDGCDIVSKIQILTKFGCWVGVDSHLKQLNTKNRD